MNAHPECLQNTGAGASTPITLDQLALMERTRKYHFGDLSLLDVVLKNVKAISHVSLLWGGALAGAGVAFLTQSILGRHLGPSDYGIFSSALSQSIILSQIAGVGLQTFWLSAFGKEGWGAQRWIPGSMKLLAISSLVSILLLLIVASAVQGTSRETYTLLMMAPSVIGYAAIELTVAKLQLEERFLAISIWQITHHFFRLALIALIISLASGGDILLWAGAVYSLVALTVIGFACHHFREMAGGNFRLHGHARSQPFVAITAESTQRTLRATWMFGADTLLYLFYFQCSNILLRHLADDQAGGLYFAAFNIMSAAYLLPTVFYTKFLLSRIHRWAHHDKRRLKTIFKVGIMAMLLAGLTCLFSIWIASERTILLFYGKEFSAAAPLLSILAMSAPLRFLSTSIGSFLTTQDQIRARVGIKTFSALICLLLNILLIPRCGATGAAIATVITELSLLVLFAVTVHARRHQIFA